MVNKVISHVVIVQSSARLSPAASPTPSTNVTVNGGATDHHQPPGTGNMTNNNGNGAGPPSGSSLFPAMR